MQLWTQPLSDLHQVHVYLVDTMVISDLALTPSGVDALSNTKVTFLLIVAGSPICMNIVIYSTRM